MTETLTPNPYSPYADADPDHRHLIPSLFGIAPTPGGLTPAACGGMAVVPNGALGDATDALMEGRTDDLPPGMCPVCVAVAAGQHVEPGQRTGHAGTCRECGSGSSHGDLCALCRQELHDAWWPTREEKPTDAR